MANEQYKILLQIDGKNNTSGAIDKTNKDLNELDKTVNKNAQSWNNFKGIVSNATGAVAIVGGLAALVGQVNALGTAATAAERTFNQVTGGADEAAASLARMRQATGGIIDDMTLMKGVNSLLITGIASTNEQAEELVNLGSRLSAVMGVDAAEGIANLNSALLNNSFMRLDTLGISAARVRERVNELKEAGMDMSAAFSQAVLEIGTQTLTDLGSAAGVAETAVGRLSTGFANLSQNLAQNVNVEIEKMAVTLEQIGVLWNLAMGNETGIPEVDAAIAQMEELNTLTEQYADQIRALDASLVQELSTLDSDLVLRVNEFLVDNQALAEQFQVAGDNAGTYFRDAFSSGNAETIAEARRLLEQAGIDVSRYTDGQLAAYANAFDVAFTSGANAIRDLRIETDALAESQAQATAEAETLAQTLATISRVSDSVFSFAQSVSNLTDMNILMGQLSDTFTDAAFTSSSGMVFFDAQEVADVRQQAEALVDEYERLKTLAEDTDFEMVSQTEVDRAREIADQATAMADEAERGARALENASLAQLAGETSGGSLGEFYDSVLAQIEDPELRAQAEAEFNRQSGRVTEDSDVLAYGAQLTASITERYGTEAGTDAGERFMSAFIEGLAMGLHGEELKAYVEEQVGYALEGTGEGQQQIEVQEGDTISAISARTGISQEDLIAANNGSTLIVPGQIITVGDGTTLIAVAQSPEEMQAETLSMLPQEVEQTVNEAPMSDYTYYDPATNTYTQVNDDAITGGQDGSLFPPEEVEAVAQVEDDMLSINDNLTEIANTDTSTALDPLISDAEAVSQELESFEAQLTSITQTEWRVRMPVEIVFDETTAEMISRNSTFVEAVRLVAPMIGLEPS